VGHRHNSQCFEYTDQLPSIRLVEETYHDPTVPDPLGQIYAILSALQQPERLVVGVGITVSTISETERQSLIQKWGPWLAIRDVERGLAVRGIDNGFSQSSLHGSLTAPHINTDTDSIIHSRRQPNKRQGTGKSR